MTKDSVSSPGLRVLRLSQVLEILGISRATHFAKLNKKSKSYDPTYPKPICLGKRTVRYVDREIQDWLAARMEDRL